MEAKKVKYFSNGLFYHFFLTCNQWDSLLYMCWKNKYACSVEITNIQNIITVISTSILIEANYSNYASHVFSLSLVWCHCLSKSIFHSIELNWILIVIFLFKLCSYCPVYVTKDFGFGILNKGKYLLLKGGSFIEKSFYTNKNIFHEDVI